MEVGTLMQGHSSLNALEHWDQSKAIDSYFECITTCDINDGVCVEQCVLVHLKQGDDGGG